VQSSRYSSIVFSLWRWDDVVASCDIADMDDSAQAINKEHTLGVRKFLIVIVSSPLETWNY